MWSLGDAEAKVALAAIPYSLPALAGDGGLPRQTLFAVKGEKDVHALGALQVVVIEDRDRGGKQAGAKKAEDACESLRRVFPAGAPVKRVLLPPVDNGYRVKDAADYMEDDAGSTLRPRAEAAGADVQCIVLHQIRPTLVHLLQLLVTSRVVDGPRRRRS